MSSLATHRPTQRAELHSDGTAGAEQGDVDPVEALRTELLHGILEVLEGEALPGGRAAGEQADAAEGEVAVRKDPEELLADGAGHADHRHRGSIHPEAHEDGGGDRRNAESASARLGERKREGGGGEMGEELVPALWLVRGGGCGSADGEMEEEVTAPRILRFLVTSLWETRPADTVKNGDSR
ncbi:hypothetical protein GW17_00037288 [Ensete ventricosum]|nr:hypothetical protein GW17_00037288 [Ensete ventricosum]